MAARDVSVRLLFTYLCFFLSLLSSCSRNDYKKIEKDGIRLFQNKDMGDLKYSCGENSEHKLWIYNGPHGTKGALAVSLQGLVNKDSPRIWFERGGMQDRILEQLKNEGWTFSYTNDPWELIRVFRQNVEGMILYDQNNGSINSATSLTGIYRSILVDLSLKEKALSEGLPIKEDVSQIQREELYERYKNRFSDNLIVELTPKLLSGNITLALRDFATQSNAFAFYDEGLSEDRRVFISERKHYPFVFGWGWDEFQWVEEVSSSGALAIPSDYAFNLSALRCLRPESSLEKPIQKPFEPLRGDESIVSFLITDGDNISWLANDFITDSRFWNHPLRHEIPLTWEIAPSLGLLAPRVARELYSSLETELGEDFVAGVSGAGYGFLSSFPDKMALSKVSQHMMAEMGLKIVTTMSHGGTLKEAEEYLNNPSIEAVIYKDYHPYHLKKGDIHFFKGKPIISLRAFLNEDIGAVPDEELARLSTPEGILERFRTMPRDPRNNLKSYAFVALHPWSWAKSGGPLDKLKEILPFIPNHIKVVSAKEFVYLLKFYYRGGQ